MTGPADTGTTRSGRRRAGPKWWAVAAAASAAGALTGTAVSYVSRPAAGSPTASPGLVSSTGSFDPGNRKPAPAWALPNLADPAATLRSDSLAGRPVVLNFWASWCPPCRKEMPALADQAHLLTGRVQFVGIDTSDQRSAAVSFAKASGVTYPLAFDPSARTADRYGAYGLPTTFFISASGAVLGRQVGGMTAGRLADLLHRTVLESSPPADQPAAKP